MSRDAIALVILEKIQDEEHWVETLVVGQFELTGTITSP